MTNVYFVRHAAPNYNNHDNLTRELTPQGLADRKLVTAFLWDKDIHAVFSSPYKRAVDTVGDFAGARKLEIGLDSAFRERTIAGMWIEDFNGFCKRQWEDFDFKLPDGESLREVQARNIQALCRLLEAWEGKNIVIGAHGTAVSTVIHYYDPTFGYQGFEDIKDRVPWIAGFSFEGKRCLEIRQYDLFSGEVSIRRCLGAPE